MKSENQQLIIILLVVFISFIGASMAYPIFPPLFLHTDYSAIVPVDWSNTTRSIMLGIALAAYPFGTFIGAPILGGCSDYYGRKPVLMFSLAISTFGYLLSALSLQFNSLPVLLFSRFLTGAMEGNLGIARAMAADLEGINKYRSLGHISAACTLGYVLGPLIGGFLSDKNIFPWFSFQLQFYLAMVFSLIALLLSIFKIIHKKKTALSTNVTIVERFNIFYRLKTLLSSNRTLKYLILISTVFTFSVDIFYEFGPVYLTMLWDMTPGQITLYTSILALSLTVGSGWLAHLLSRHYTSKQTILYFMMISGLIFGLLIVYPTKLSAFILFGLAGLSLAVVNTNITVEVSNSADKTIQGEALGTLLSLRTLGDAIICLVGGFLIISSVFLPIAFSCIFAIVAAIAYKIQAD